MELRYSFSMFCLLSDCLKYLMLESQEYTFNMYFLCMAWYVCATWCSSRVSFAALHLLPTAKMELAHAGPQRMSWDPFLAVRTKAVSLQRRLDSPPVLVVMHWGLDRWNATVSCRPISSFVSDVSLCLSACYHLLSTHVLRVDKFNCWLQQKNLGFIKI